MNPNHPFNGSFPNLNMHSFALPGTKQGSQLFNLPAANMYAPLQYFPSLSQPKSESSKHPSSFDLVIDPTKRVKHEQNSYTQSGFKMEDVPLLKEDHLLLRGEQLKVESDLTTREDLRNLTLDPSMRQNPFGSEMGSDIPPELLELLKNQQIDQFSKQQIAQQFLMKQLEQQRAEAFAKQEMFKRLQQQQFEMLMQQKLYQQLQQSVSSQLLDQMKDSHKKPDALGGILNQPNLYPFLMNGGGLPNQLDVLKGMGLDEISSNPYLMSKAQKEDQPWKNKLESGDLARKKHNNPLVENREIKNNQLFMTDNRNKIDVISPQKNSIYETYAAEETTIHEKDLKTNANKEKAKPKKRRSYNYSYDYFNALSSVSAEQKSKSELRRKNKWQMMAQENDESLGSSRKSTRMMPSRKSTLNDEQGAQEQIVAGNPEFVEDAQPAGTEILVDPKGHKNAYPEDDSNVDWERLLFRTITKIPESEENFAVIDHRERMAEHYEEGGVDEPFDTKVGNAYQAAIPELDLTDAPHDSKKRRCELIWSPKALDEAEIERYLSDLCQILNCQSVNQEKALKLLKRKNYKKDKVKVNISKNEKFYSSFLVAMEPIKAKENP